MCREAQGRTWEPWRPWMALELSVGPHSFFCDHIGSLVPSSAFLDLPGPPLLKPVSAAAQSGPQHHCSKRNLRNLPAFAAVQFGLAKLQHRTPLHSSAEMGSMPAWNPSGRQTQMGRARRYIGGGGHCKNGHSLDSPTPDSNHSRRANPI